MTGDGTDRERDPGRVPEMFAFVGSQTTGAGEGITILPYDGRTGDFREGRLIHDTGNPTFLEIDAARSMLYAVQEMESFEGSPGGGLATYSLALGRDGAVRATRLCSQSSLGTSPCHVVTEPQRRTLFVSNYRDGVLSVFPLDGHGEPGPAIQEFRYLGHGPNEDRQECAHVHSVSISPDGRYVLIADLGRDLVVRYPISIRTGTLNAEEVMETSVAPGSGPRHFAFHPRGAFLYAVEELSSEITVFRWDEREGIPREIQTVSTLPEGFNGENLAADVHPTVDGRFLYCSNRGHNSIACFGVSADTGRLESLGHTPCGGSWPRNFALDPNGRFLFVANSRSDSIVRFQVNAESGALSPAGEPLHVGEPMCIKFSPLPAMQG